MSAHPRWASLALRLYPRGFRRSYGAAVAQGWADLRHRGNLRGGSLAWRVFVDLARSVPTQRWEAFMNLGSWKMTVPVVLLSVAVMAALVGSPMLGLAAVAVAAAITVVAIMARGADQPIRTIGSSSHPGRWLLGSVAAFAVGAVVLVIDGDELTEGGWLVWMLSWSSALVLAVTAAMTALSRLVQRRRPAVR